MKSSRSDQDLRRTGFSLQNRQSQFVSGIHQKLASKRTHQDYPMRVGQESSLTERAWPQGYKVQKAQMFDHPGMTQTMGQVSHGFSHLPSRSPVIGSNSRYQNNNTQRSLQLSQDLLHKTAQNPIVIIEDEANSSSQMQPKFQEKKPQFKPPQSNFDNLNQDNRNFSLSTPHFGNFSQEDIMSAMGSTLDMHNQGFGGASDFRRASTGIMNSTIDYNLLMRQYEGVIQKLNTELQKSLGLSQQYKSNYEMLAVENKKLNEQNADLRKAIENVREMAQKRVEFSEGQRKKILSELQIKDEELRIQKKLADQLKLEISGQKIEIESKKAINERVGRNEQNLFQQVSEQKQKVMDLELQIKRKQNEMDEVRRELMLQTQKNSKNTIAEQELKMELSNAQAKKQELEGKLHQIQNQHNHNLILQERAKNQNSELLFKIRTLEAGNRAMSQTIRQLKANRAIPQLENSSTPPHQQNVVELDSPYRRAYSSSYHYGIPQNTQDQRTQQTNLTLKRTSDNLTPVEMRDQTQKNKVGIVGRSTFQKDNKTIQEGQRKKEEAQEEEKKGSGRGQDRRDIYNQLCKRHNESKRIEGVFNWQVSNDLSPTQALREERKKEMIEKFNSSGKDYARVTFPSFQLTSEEAREIDRLEKELLSKEMERKKLESEVMKLNGRSARSVAEKQLKRRVEEKLEEREKQIQKLKKELREKKVLTS